METEKQKARRKMWKECAGMVRLNDDSSGKRPSTVGLSAFVLDLTEQEIRGEITIDEMIEKINEHYTVKQETINEKV